jgi:LysR family glycine cleavage system transcriptional activator
VLANAGLAICGLALLAEHPGDGSLRLPFPISTGRRTSYAFHARFCAWMLEESASTQAWLDTRIAGSTAA